MIRILFLLLILAAHTLSLHAQSVDEWAARLRTFGQSIPQEEVFLHLDNTAYYLGDTIYYKAYSWLSSGTPSPLSQMLYVELLNQDGYLVERQKVEMQQGQGYGSFVLLDTLYGGYYELRAYTRWQLNWGLYEHPHTQAAEQWFYSKKMMQQYYRDYEKLYSRVFPVYDKPKEPGQYNENMTTRPLRRYFRTQTPKAEATLTFYPEGGALVAGTQQRVAFQADNADDGEHLQGTLTVQTSSGQTVATAETENRGRGSFTLQVKEGEQYKAQFQWDGNTSTAKLPTPEKQGVALNATHEAQGIRIELQATGQAASEPLGITAQCHGQLQYFASLPSAASHTLVVPADSLRTGVIQLTVFNAEGRIWADRLCFWNNGDLQQSRIAFSGINPDGYDAYSPISLQVEGAPGATISLAVRDSRTSAGNFDSGNLLTEHLLASQIRGFVEQPEYYFQADDESHRRHLDLLLMVQGWRRYKWVEMATPGAFSLAQPYERTQWLYGSVNTYQTVEEENEFTKASREALVEAGMDVDAEARAAEEAVKESQQATINFSGQETTTVGDTEEEREQRFSDDETHQGTTSRTNSDVSTERFLANEGSLRREMRVHAEFVQPGAEQNGAVEGDMDTYNKGLFRIQAPKLYEACWFFLEASDTTKWKKNEEHIWIQQSEDKNERVEYPEFYVKLDLPYPRFVQPYNFYQTNQPMVSHAAKQKAGSGDDITVMKEVVIGAKRSGMRQFDSTKPAFVLDAYEAFNAVVDAGLCPGYFIGAQRFCYDIARTFVGDMNMERAYDLEQRWNTRNATSYLSSGVKEKYNHLSNLDKIYIYTDYSPRNEGSEKYNQSNQPRVTIDLRRYEDDSKRMVWRNRRMKLTGFAVCEDFYNPQYKQKPTAPATDYRRTLYWAPNLQLDQEGHAQVDFYNNSQHTLINVSAEGLTSQGQPLSGMLWADEL